jgi:hypothetical protein
MYIVCGIAIGMPPCIATLCIGAAPAPAADVGRVTRQAL